MKTINRVLATVAAAGIGVTGLLGASAASAATPAPLGERSAVSVLLADGDEYDNNWYDFDVVTEAAKFVLANKPNSPVGVLADGSVPLTAFLPNDRAFQVLVADLTRSWKSNERSVGDTVKSLGADTVETVLLYHVVPGATIDSAAALNADGAALKTAQGGTFTVDVISKRFAIVQLKDQDKNDINPFLVRSKLDINKGNKQIAHGISFVLRPVDLR